MAITVVGVLWMMSIAVLLSGGLVRDFNDEGTPVLLGFTAAVFWAISGLSAYSVESEAWTGTKAMEPLAIVGIGMAMLVMALSLMKLARAIRAETGTTPISD